MKQGVLSEVLRRMVTYVDKAEHIRMCCAACTWSGKCVSAFVIG